MPSAAAQDADSLKASTTNDPAEGSADVGGEVGVARSNRWVHGVVERRCNSPRALFYTTTPHRITPHFTTLREGEICCNGPFTKDIDLWVYTTIQWKMFATGFCSLTVILSNRSLKHSIFVRCWFMFLANVNIWSTRYLKSFCPKYI